MDLLTFEDVKITYQNKKEAVSGVTFSVPEKSIVSIVGESGSGKSTLIRAAIGLLPPGGRVTEGKILFDEKEIGTLSHEEMRKMRGCEMAMIFQDAGAFLNPRVKIGKQYLETLSAHMNISRKEQEKIAKDMLLKLKLSDPDRIMKSYPFQLSGGMRQRVAIAMAMSMQPKLLLADEPTSALDVTVQAQVVQEILNLRQEYGTSVVMVTHNMGVASRISDYIAVMKSGHLMEFGPRDQVIMHPQSDYTKMLLSVVPELEGMKHE